MFYLQTTNATYGPFDGKASAETYGNLLAIRNGTGFRFIVRIPLVEGWEWLDNRFDSIIPAPEGFRPNPPIYAEIDN